MNVDSIIQGGGLLAIAAIIFAESVVGTYHLTRYEHRWVVVAAHPGAPQFATR